MMISSALTRPASAGDHFAQFSMHCLRRHDTQGDGMVQVADDAGLLGQVCDYFCLRQQPWIDLLLVLVVGATAAMKVPGGPCRA